MLIINNVRLPLEYNDEILKQTASKHLKIKATDINTVEIKKISVDARKKNDVHYVATIRVSVSGIESRILNKSSNDVTEEKIREYSFTSTKKFIYPPVVVGSGPAGLFAALLLARCGAKPTIIERGECVENRTKTVNTFWEKGILNTNSNVQFGEGGAGTFSDGKLNTGTKDFRAGFILKEFVNHGAPEDILTNAKPHIGTDMLKIAIKGIREEIISLGGTFRFNTRFTDFCTTDGRITSITVEKDGYKETIDTDSVILAIGHSARDTFELLKNKSVCMEQKAFSIGARIEHNRDFVNETQYGRFKDKLKAADYKMSTHLKDGRGVYTFCMCPGGYVVNASSEEGMLCTNGMSLYARDAENSNSAVLVSVNPKDYDCGDVLDGVKLQRTVEKAAFEKIGGYLAPVQSVGDFLKNSGRIKTNTKPSILPGYELTDISPIFPDFISNSLKEGLFALSEKTTLFSDMGAVLTCAETRSSSPVRIVRDENYCSISTKGLYPCGEGAGYAGGIMSAAADGLKVAEKILT